MSVPALRRLPVFNSLLQVPACSQSRIADRSHPHQRQFQRLPTDDQT
jgi:hypothetical protein